MKQSVRLLTLVGVVVVVAGAVSWQLVVKFGVPFSFLLGLLILAEAASELFPIRLSEDTTISVSYPLDVAALVLFGPPAALLTALAGIVSHLVKSGKGGIKAVYNVAQVLTATGVASIAYVLVAGSMSLPTNGVEYLDASVYPEMLLPTVVFSVVAFLLNTTLVGGAVSITQSVRFGSVWRSNFGWQLSTQLALALMGLTLAHALLAVGAAGLLLFFTPLAIVRSLLLSTIGLRQAYSDAVRALVAALEVKDPYTRGHSERVASLATSIARELGLAQATVDQLELAALLHDLGKVAISNDVLCKAGGLTAHELNLVRKHPATAVEIITKVSFLAELDSAILYHHERFDGGGYGQGLSGEQIPLEARILAVADSFDAMTSNRPYRGAMTIPEACQELRDHSGSQFDPQVVEVFLSSRECHSIRTTYEEEDKATELHMRAGTQ